MLQLLNLPIKVVVLQNRPAHAKTTSFSSVSIMLKRLRKYLSFTSKRKYNHGIENLKAPLQACSSMKIYWHITNQVNRIQNIRNHQVLVRSYELLYVTFQSWLIQQLTMNHTFLVTVVETSHVRSSSFKSSPLGSAISTFSLGFTSPLGNCLASRTICKHFLALVIINRKRWLPAGTLSKPVQLLAK